MGRLEVILLDTHIVLWLAGDETRLSKKARAAIEEGRQRGEGLAISDVTLLEVTTLASKGRIRLGANLESFLAEVERRFVVLPITARACVGFLNLPANFPKDPADRIIAATALVEGMSLVTADEKIRRSGALPTIW
jgi:PIN domain nuclease of toxin-antitoxin system